MRKLIVFNSVTVDGYFTSASGDMSWAHRGDDPEWNAFVAGNASGEGELLFGRVTYDMMASFWPTPMAQQAMPKVAAGMNRMRKTVVSRTMTSADWENTTVLTGDLAASVRKLKEADGPGIAILGSGTIVAQLAEANLIDEYQLVVVPVVLGAGRTLFDGVRHPPALKLGSSRAFRNGNVVLTYEPEG